MTVTVTARRRRRRRRLTTIIFPRWTTKFESNVATLALEQALDLAETMTMKVSKLYQNHQGLKLSMLLLTTLHHQQQQQQLLRQQQGRRIIIIVNNEIEIEIEEHQRRHRPPPPPPPPLYRGRSRLYCPGPLCMEWEEEEYHRRPLQQQQCHR